VVTPADDKSIKQLCQDFSFKVREETARELPRLADILPHEEFSNHFKEDYIELLEDEEIEVVIAALESLPRISKQFNLNLQSHLETLLQSEVSAL